MIHSRESEAAVLKGLNHTQMQCTVFFYFFVSQARYHVDMSIKCVISPSAYLLPDLKSGGGGAVSGDAGERGLPRFTSVLQPLDNFKATSGQLLVVFMLTVKSN